MSEQLTSTQKHKVDVHKFLDLASQNNWEEFDSLAIGFSEDPDYLAWTQFGLKSPKIDVRDLAITILEHTSSPLFNKRIKALKKVRDLDDNLHLRGKASIALFVHEKKDPKTLKTLHEAYENDSELKDQIKDLLGIE